MKKAKSEKSKKPFRRRAGKPRATDRLATEGPSVTASPPPDAVTGCRHPVWALILFLLGVALTAAHFSAHPSNWDVWGSGSTFHLRWGFWPLVGGLLSWAALVWILPREPHEGPGLSHRMAGVLFWTLMALGMWFRFAGFWNQGLYWDEMAEYIFMPRKIFELGDFVFSSSQTFSAAFYDYLVVLLWSFNPEAPAYVIQRLTPGVMEFFTLWFLYLFGREYGGRRAGIYTLAVGVLFKPLIWECVRALQHSSVPFFGAWTLLFALRFSKKPSLKNALLFGTVLGLGLYAYNAHRIILPLFMMGVFAFSLARLARSAPRAFGAALTFSLAWLFAFFAISRVLPVPPTFLGWVSWPWTLPLFGVLLAIYARRFAKGVPPDNHVAARWIIALVASWVVMLPILMDRTFGDRFLLILSTMPGGESGQAEFLKSFLSGLARTWRALYYGGSEDGFSLVGPIMGALSLFGIVHALLRPSLFSLFMLSLIAASVGAHALPRETHNARIVAIHLPLILLIGISLEKLRRCWQADGRGRILGRAFLAVLLAFGALTAIFNQYQIHDRVAARTTLSTMVRDLLRKEDPTDRLYVASNTGVGLAAFCILAEDIPVYILDKRDKIFTRPGEKPPRVVLYYSLHDKEMATTLRKEYPGAETTAFAYPGEDPTTSPAVWRVRISPRELEKSRAGLFEVVRMDARPWDRQVYSLQNGLGHGFYSRDDPAWRLSDPFTPNPWEQAVRAAGVWRVDRGGAYRFEGETCGAIQLRLDGRRVLAARPFRRNLKKFSTVVHVAPGRRFIELKSFLSAQQPVIPEIKVTGPDGVTRLLGDDAPLEAATQSSILPLSSGRAELGVIETLRKGARHDAI